jgi:hypothetical protein
LQVLQFRHQLLFDCACQALNSLAGWTYEKAVVTERPLWPPVTELPSTNWLGVSRPSQMPFGIFPLSVLGNWIQLLVSRCFKFQVFHPSPPAPSFETLAPTFQVQRWLSPATGPAGWTLSDAAKNIIYNVRTSWRFFKLKDSPVVH